MSSDIPPGDGAGDVPLPFVASPAYWQGRNVLVVDDHPTYCLLMGGILQRLGLGFEVCGDGQAALAALDVQRFDLILTDCQMPVMDGFTLTREVRRRERETFADPVPIIALTSSLEPDDVRQCLEAGINAWFVKPLTFTQLRDVLWHWLVGGTAPLSAEQCIRETGWPTRARLEQVFGGARVLDGMLASLVKETQGDLQALSSAMACLDAGKSVQHLHRLIGGVAFLGVAPLEERGGQLIVAVNRDGVAAHTCALFGLWQDLVRYLKYLTAL